jgi:hypothetical protein
VRGKGGGRGKGGVMTQSLYAHMNKGNFLKRTKNQMIISIEEEKTLTKLNFFHDKAF